MSRKSRNRTAARLQAHAPVFAALGDETRLSLVVGLSCGRPRSISQLTAGTKLTRQAIAKHLRVLQRIGMVHSTRVGRERLFEFNPQPIEGLKEYLALVSAQWDQSLSRLKLFVEN
jgi:DNA-binding transcriptional ArsR family regulator